jgi:hypothetical protein
LARLPDDLDLDESAGEHGALTHRRLVRDGPTLFLLALGYGPGAMRLRSVTTWAAACDIAKLSDIGELKRLKKADGGLSRIAATLLAEISPSRVLFAATHRERQRDPLFRHRRHCLADACEL